MLRMTLAVLIAGTALCAEVPRRAHENLNADLWVQHSVEFRGITTGIYRCARVSLDRALKDKKWTAFAQTGKYRQLPPAVITDIDETILDNSPAQARFITAGQTYNRKEWNQWVDEAAARPLAGALEFFRYAASRGVTIFYVTNREKSQEEATRKNLLAAGFPVREDIDVLLMQNERPDWTGDKETRREFVAATHRILLLCGDDFGDFVPKPRTGMEERNAAAVKADANWGTRWFVLPNPQYGSWEYALTAGQVGLTDEKRIEFKYGLLKTKP